MPSTKVVSASGAAVAISSLKVGDKVRSLDVKTGKSTARAVTRVHVNHDADLLDLTVVRNGHRAVLHTTARHPFWSQTRKAWVRADQLATTDRLRTDQVKTDKTGAVRVARVVAVPGDEARWDLTVATDHDYYVVAGSAPVLVHNCGAEAKGGVYSLRDEAGAVVRTGRTKNLSGREATHARDKVLGDYSFNVELRTDVYSEQGGLEQVLFDRHPEAQLANGGLNKIRAIGLLNPRYGAYMKSADNYLAKAGAR